MLMIGKHDDHRQEHSWGISFRNFLLLCVTISKIAHRGDTRTDQPVIHRNDGQFVHILVKFQLIYSN